MNGPGWRTSRAVQGRDLHTGNTVMVIVGLVETATDGVQLVLQLGDGHPAVLSLQDARQHALNVNETTAERLKITAEALGDDQS